MEHVPRHTIPMSRAHAKLYAIHLSGLNHAKSAVGVLLQRELGLRPGEVLGLMGSDVALLEHHSGAVSTRAVLGLGLRTGTKAKRAQAVILVASESIAEGAFLGKVKEAGRWCRRFWESVHRHCFHLADQHSPQAQGA